MAELLIHMIYIKQTPQDKADLGIALCKIHKRITYNIYIVTSTNGTNPLLYIVDLQFYLPLIPY